MKKKEARIRALEIVARETQAMSGINLGIGGRAERQVAAALLALADQLERKADRLSAGRRR